MLGSVLGGAESVLQRVFCRESREGWARSVGPPLMQHTVAEDERLPAPREDLQGSGRQRKVEAVEGSGRQREVEAAGGPREGSGRVKERQRKGSGRAKEQAAGGPRNRQRAGHGKAAGGPRKGSGRAKGQAVCLYSRRALLGESSAARAVGRGEL